jgi:cytochrome d ubiquinol oxidase subunit I
LQLTSAGVSPSVPAWEVLVTVVGFTVLYGGLAVIEVGLLVKRIRGTVAEVGPGWPATPTIP